MERPNVKNQPKKREVTGEIAYFNDMRRLNQFPERFDDLSDMAIDMYETEAAIYNSQGTQPAIMDLYDEYDGHLSDTEASCIALADELLTLKDQDSPLTFVDICVDKPAADVLNQLKSTKAGELLTADDEQLAIESNGEYYPILDMRKDQADLVGVGLRVWGWNHEKYTFIDSGENQRNPQRDILRYPAGEKLAQRQLEITFIYVGRQQSKDGSNRFNESVSLMVDEHGSAALSRSVWAMAYSETGYEGHKHASLNAIEESDVAVFGDLVAEMVGDDPESIGMRQDRKLAKVMDRAANDAAKNIVKELIDITWPAQANYILNLKQRGSQKTLAEMLQHEDGVDQAIELLRRYIDGQQ